MTRLPVLSSLAGYRAAWLPRDASAGVAVAMVGLPTAIAYPAIAGLPPETGIYASIAAAVGYAVFGPSRNLMTGPDAGTMTVIAATLAAALPAVSGVDVADRVEAAAALALIVGAFCFIARLLGLGVIASFLSRPILVGFFAGIAMSIIIGQIGRVTGLSIEAKGLIPPLVELAQKAGDIHWPTLALATGLFVLMQGLSAARFPIPAPVVVVVLAVLLSAIFDFRGLGIATVGDIPSGLPAIGLPKFGGLALTDLVLGAAAIFLVSFGAGIVTARSFGDRAGYRVDPNQELVGFGAANVAAGMFYGFPVSASDSRTAINLSVGGQTQASALFAAAVLIATLLFLNPALRVLPLSALSAILIAAALSMIDLGALRHIWRVSHVEFVFALIAMAGAVSFGVLEGVVVAVAATLAYLIYKTMHPRHAMLGRIADRDGFYKLHRNAAAEPVPGLAVCLIQGSFLFYAAENVQTRLTEIAEKLPADTRWFVIDASAITHVDGTGAAMLDEFVKTLAGRGIAVGLAELHADVRGLLERAGVIARIGPAMIFEDLEDMLDAFEASGAGAAGSAAGRDSIAP